MARRVEWTATALNDLEHVWEYIAKDSAYYASAFVRRTRDTARSLNEFSFRGRMVPEFQNASVREIYVNQYRLIYHVSQHVVEILAFIHGARDLPTVWEQEHRPKPEE